MPTRSNKPAPFAPSAPAAAVEDPLSTLALEERLEVMQARLKELEERVAKLTAELNAGGIGVTR